MSMDTVKVRELPTKNTIDRFDSMIVEDNDGTKTVTVADIRHFLQANSYFETVEDMKQAFLYEGDIVTTLGYRKKNDGGGATYEIVYAPTDLDDGQLVHYLYTSDTLRAHLIHNGTLDILKVGAHGDGKTDDSDTIMQALKTGLEVTFPKRNYFLAKPLELLSDLTINFNDSTLTSPYGAAISLGLKLPIKNIIIKNAIFRGMRGIELYAHASNVTIDSCVFKNYKDQPMNYAIDSYGCSNLKITNCDIGDTSNEVKEGISINSGSIGGTSVGNDTILITNNNIYASVKCIKLSSAAQDKHIVISHNMLTGFGSNRNNVNTTGLDIANRCNSIIISSCSLNRMLYGINIYGTQTMSVGLTDISTDDVHIMYNISDQSAKVHLAGFQKHNGSDYSNADYLFDNMSGTLYINTTIDLSPRSSVKKIIQAKSKLDGWLVDSVPTYGKTKANVIGASNHNAVMNNVVPGYMNVSINMGFGGEIAKLNFPSLKGQVVCLYSAYGLKLKKSSHLTIGSDVTLNATTGVYLINVGSTWERLQ